jgi:hypothetical protein
MSDYERNDTIAVLSSHVNVTIQEEAHAMSTSLGTASVRPSSTTSLARRVARSRWDRRHAGIVVTENSLDAQILLLNEKAILSAL